MNGLVAFEMSPHGWRVNAVVEFADPIRRKVVSLPEDRLVVVYGNFPQRPRKGQFCARPHKLIDVPKQFMHCPNCSKHHLSPVIVCSLCKWEAK